MLAKVPLPGDSDDENAFPGASLGVTARRNAQQKRFRTGERTDSLYFGSPGLASVIAEVSKDPVYVLRRGLIVVQFADVQLEPKSLAHAMPRGADMYAAEGSMYPFPTLWTANTNIPGLYSCLQPWNETLMYLDSYKRRAETYPIPPLAQEVTRKEVERFVDHFEENAMAFPDMLAVIFAALATGRQVGVHERCGGKWVAGAVEADRRRGDLFRRSHYSIVLLRC